MSAQYPFGERAYHPYKIWLDVVKKTVAFRLAEERYARVMESAPKTGLFEESKP